MKKLLYVAALAVLSTSCSVDNIQDENSTNLNNIETRTQNVLVECGTAKIVSDKGETNGLLTSFIDEEKGLLIIKLTSWDWKIRESELYLGPKKNVVNAEANDIFDLGKYSFTETFEDGVYETQYEFQLIHIDYDFVLYAELNLTSDKDSQLAWAQGIPLIGHDGYYLDGFLHNCIKH